MSEEGETPTTLEYHTKTGGELPSVIEDTETENETIEYTHNPMIKQKEVDSTESKDIDSVAKPDSEETPSEQPESNPDNSNDPKDECDTLIQEKLNEHLDKNKSPIKVKALIVFNSETNKWETTLSDYVEKNAKKSMMDRITSSVGYPRRQGGKSKRRSNKKRGKSRRGGKRRRVGGTTKHHSF